MPEEKPKQLAPSPRKLVRVLVAAGMALGGLAARAQEKPSTDEKAAAPAEKGGQETAKEKDAKAKAEKEKQQKKKKAEEKKAEDEGGGVKGW